MKHSHKPSAELLAQVTAAIAKADRRSRRKFDGLLGSLAEEAPPLLSEIFGYLQRYLLDERGFSEERVRRLYSEALLPRERRPPLKEGDHESEFRSTSPELEDEGVKVALGVLNSIASALTINDKQTVRLLLSGKDGLRGAKVREGGGRRGASVQEERGRYVAGMQAMLDETACRYPAWGYRKLADHVGRAFGCDERTVRRNTRNPRLKGGRGTTS